MLLKPDRHAGRPIFRGVTMGSDGINHQNEMILFPPALMHARPPVKPLSELVDEAMKRFVVVGENKNARINVSTTIGALEKAFRKLVAFYMKRAALNERERIRRALEKHGLKEAQHAMMDGAE